MPTPNRPQDSKLPADQKHPEQPQASRPAAQSRPQDWRVQGRPVRHRSELQHQARRPGRRRPERPPVADHRPDQHAARAGAMERRQPASAARPAWRIRRRLRRWPADQPGRIRTDREGSRRARAPGSLGAPERPGRRGRGRAEGRHCRLEPRQGRHPPGWPSVCAARRPRTTT